MDITYPESLPNPHYPHDSTGLFPPHWIPHLTPSLSREDCVPGLLRPHGVPYPPWTPGALRDPL